MILGLNVVKFIEGNHSQLTNVPLSCQEMICADNPDTNCPQTKESGEFCGQNFYKKNCRETCDLCGPNGFV